MPVAPARHAGPPALTLGAPTRYCVGALCVRLGACLVGACCGRVCLRVAGFRVYARGVFVWVFACLLVCVRLGVVGQCGPAAPPLLRLACLRAHALVWACWRVRGSACSMGGWRSGRGGTIVSRPFTCVGGAVHRLMRARGRREGLGVRALSWCANTCAHGERKRGGRGGASWGGQWWPGWGLWVVARWVVTRIGGEKYPKSGESEIDTTGVGAR